MNSFSLKASMGRVAFSRKRRIRNSEYDAYISRLCVVHCVVEILISFQAICRIDISKVESIDVLSPLAYREFMRIPSIQQLIGIDNKMPNTGPVICLLFFLTPVSMVTTCWVDGGGLPKLYVCSSLRYTEGGGGGEC